MKTVLLILLALVAALATAALFTSPDGQKLVVDFDRETFGGFSAMTAGAIWLGALFVLCRRAMRRSVRRAVRRAAIAEQ